jgi:ABC-type lipoprotein release transport system permease subunit
VDVKPTDPATFVSVALLFLLLATVAAWVPAWRAATLDPTEALRDE